MEVFKKGDLVQVLTKRELIGEFNLTPGQIGRSFRDDPIRFVGDMWSCCGKIYNIEQIGYDHNNKPVWYRLKDSNSSFTTGWAFTPRMIKHCFKESEEIEVCEENAKIIDDFFLGITST